MNILFVSRWFPYPPDNGSKVRVYNLLKHLSTRHQIDLVSFAQGPVQEDHLAQIKGICRSVETTTYKEFSPLGFKALAGVFSRYPRVLLDTYSPQMWQLVSQAVDRRPYDVVVASQLGSTPYLPSASGVPRIFDEVELARPYERVQRARNPASRLRHSLNWRKLSAYVSGLFGELDGCTVVSEHEKRLLAQVVPGYEGCIVVPNGVDLDLYAGDFGVPKRDTLIYSGALTYDANYEAMAFFLKHVYPLVKAQCPHVTLKITGRTGGVRVDRLSLDPSVELTGYLEDIRPAIAQSWASIVPLRTGGGTRLKILEAMALGTPVVATTKGAEGIDVRDGENILLADNPEALADAIVRLLQDETLRLRLARNGRQLVAEYYGWDTCVDKLEQLLLCAAAHGVDRRRIVRQS